MITDFKLPDSFVDAYAKVDSPFGFKDVVGTSLGEITYIRTYSRLKDDGTKERWHETVRRVIEGMYTIQKRHVRRSGLPWSNQKAQRSARAAFDSLFHLKWSPPGRGLWAMGSPLVMDEENSAPLQNCAMVSTSSMTREDPGKVFAWMMEVSMVGVGVGFDTQGSKKDFLAYTPSEPANTFVIPDSREGWAESLRLLINSHLLPGGARQEFDYSQIRPEGEPIKRFGGKASGPEPLRQLHEAVRGILVKREGHTLTITDIADIGNLIGVCVVAGNVRRSAELLLGDLYSSEFLSLKDYDSDAGRARVLWGWMSNNSVAASVNDDLESIVPGIIQNGEPGVVWMDMLRGYGRLKDGRNDSDHRVMGVNPCAEQGLESFEMCTLVETFPSRCDSLEEYLEVLKYAYLYAKTVTLMKTPWPETNAIMLRNRRIGTSMTGLADFVDERGEAELVRWQDQGYGRLRALDKTYSEWLAVRESIKVSTVKPSGTVSLLAGVTPGVHWQPGTEFYFRLMRIGNEDPLALAARDAGYRVELSMSDPATTSVIYFPMKRESKRGEHDVSLMEKLNLAIVSQKYWSDNAVSVTLTYAKDEERFIGAAMKMARGNLKTISFLPLAEGSYAQMPYTASHENVVNDTQMTHLSIFMDDLYANGQQAVGERGCSNDHCVI